MTVCDYNTIIELESAVLSIYNLPIGTELRLERVEGKLQFFNSVNGDKVNIRNE